MITESYNNFGLVTKSELQALQIKNQSEYDRRGFDIFRH